MNEESLISVTNMCTGSTLTVEGKEIPPGATSKIPLSATFKKIHFTNHDTDSKFIQFPIGEQGIITGILRGIDPKKFLFEISTTAGGGFGPTNNVIIGDDKR